MNNSGEALSVLEPSCGIGNFIGAMPNGLASKVTGVELDSISGRIASFLYPSSNIVISDFRDFRGKNFDAVVGNVPFAKMNVDDKSYRGLEVMDEDGSSKKVKLNLHNYFITKSLDMTRAGGIVAVISSSSTLDGANDSARRNLAQMGDFLGAVRLPNTAFKGAAGTEVVSDIIFLQKRDVQRFDVNDQAWIKTTESDLDPEVSINSYFAEHPEMVLGEQTVSTNRFGKKVITVKDNGEDLTTAINKVLPNILAETDLERLAHRPEGIAVDGEVVIPGIVQDDIGSYKFYNDDVYYIDSEDMATKVDLKSPQKQKLVKFNALYDSYRHVIELQKNNCTDDELKEAQADLMDKYKAFTAGQKKNTTVLINSSSNSFLREDYRYSALSALETLDKNRELESLSDIFTERTVGGYSVPVIETAEDALNSSLLTTGQVNFDLMENLLNGRMTKAEILDEVGGRLFRDPDKVEVDSDGYDGWVEADEYLSGNVVEKLSKARAASINDKEAYSRNVAALEPLQPQRVLLSDIRFNLGSAFIDEDIVQSFVLNKFGGKLTVKRDGGKYVVSDTKASRWSISSEQRSNREHYTDFGVDSKGHKVEIGFKSVLESALNQKKLEYKEKGPDGKETPNKDISNAVYARTRELEEEFLSYVLEYTNPEHSNRIEERYNALYNSIVPRKFDGTKLGFNGMNPSLELRPHQRNAVARQLYGGNTLLAHEVGAGKTYAMVAAAMEGKRLGLHKKSLIVVPNAVHEQWIHDINRLYPEAKVLAPDVSTKGLSADNRKRLMARIANGNYDIVLITHEQLEKFSLSKETMKAFVEDYTARMKAVLEKLNAQSGGRPSKEIAENMASLQRYLEERLKEGKDKAGLDFEELGIDKIFVDEAHMFKNLAEPSCHSLKGQGKTTANKSLNMFALTSYMNKKYGDNRIVMATGTPVSNNLTEFYTMMRYLQPTELKAHRLEFLDDFLSSFGKIEQRYELNTNGEWAVTERLLSFINVPEMMNIFQQCADIITVDKLGLDLPESQTHIRSNVASPEQVEIAAELRNRAEQCAHTAAKAGGDNLLKITTDNRKMALDQRMFDNELKAAEVSKVTMVCDEVKRIYDADPTHKDTQLIFSDLGTPGAGKEFDVYTDIREKLAASGIPAEEVAFIHEYDTKEKKKDLMAKVNEGKVRVVIGSTSKLGTGVNCQKFLKAVHHIDVPWRPSDIIQRNGRIVRQGNTHKNVEIYMYVTQGTCDPVLYEKLLTKEKFVHQIMHFDSSTRSIEAVNDDNQLTYEEAMTASSSDRRVGDKAKISREFDILKASRNSFLMRRASAEKNLQGLPAKIEDTENKLNTYHKMSQDFALDQQRNLTLLTEYSNYLKNTYQDGEANRRLYTNGIMEATFRIKSYRDPTTGFYKETKKHLWRSYAELSFDNSDEKLIIPLKLGAKPETWLKTLNEALPKAIAKRTEELSKSLNGERESQERLKKLMNQPAIFKEEKEFQRISALNEALQEAMSLPKETFDSITQNYEVYQQFLKEGNHNDYIDMVVQENINNKVIKIDEAQAPSPSNTDGHDKDDHDKLYRLSKGELEVELEAKPRSREEVEQAKKDGFKFDKKDGKFKQRVPKRTVDAARKQQAEAPKAQSSKAEAVQSEGITADVGIRYYPGKSFDITKAKEEVKAHMYFDHGRKEWFCLASAKEMKPIEDFIKTLDHSARRREDLQNELKEKGIWVKIKRPLVEKAVRSTGKLFRAVKDGAEFTGSVVKEISAETVGKYLEHRKEQKMLDELREDARRQGVVNRPEGRIYLSVPYADKDEAHRLGAKWEPKGPNSQGAGRWYATKSNIDKLRKWEKPREVPSQVLESDEDSINAMIKDMRENGMNITREQLKFDGSGNAHGRCRCEGDRQGETAGWYSIHLDGCPTCVMCNHRTGGANKTRSYPNRSSVQRMRQNTYGKVYSAQIADEVRKQETTKKAEHDAKLAYTSKKIRSELERYHHNKAEYPESTYLQSKGLTKNMDEATYMLKTKNDCYTCFAFSNINGQITTKQYISSQTDPETGKFAKRWETGGQKAGSFHVVNGFQKLAQGNTPLIIAEGIATALSVQSAIGQEAVVVSAGDCGNLMSVAKALREKFPDRAIVMAADNDHLRQDNPGLFHANEAAKAIGGTVISPQFGPGDKGTDFNDVMITKGIDSVKSIIHNHLEQNCKHKKGHNR